MYLIALLFAFFQYNGASVPCNYRQTETGFVCVCNSSYCDSVPEIGYVDKNSFKIITTSGKSPGFVENHGLLSKSAKAASAKLTIDKRTYQEIYGFGGAFTDSTGHNILSLSENAQKRLIASYFGQSGIGYTLCRVPIAGSDFSPRPYSYDDFEGDVNMTHFSLQEEDFKYKIPFIKQAHNLDGNLKLIATPWTAPPWMKNNNVWSGYSMLSEDHYRTFVVYLIKFLEEYKAQGIPIWGLTTGNEPLNGFWTLSHSKINSMGWIPGRMNIWIREYLGPLLRNSKFSDIKVITHDDALLTIPHVIPVLYNDKETMRFIDGVGTHWYWDKDIVPNVLDFLHYKEKDIFRISTESCHFLAGVVLGDLDRGFDYASSIIHYMKYGFAGWVDWNMALTPEGGPTYIDFFADSPIIVNSKADEFYKQPMFYMMGHFAKYVEPGSIRVGLEVENLNETEIQTVAFQRPDNQYVVTILNNGTSDATLQIGNVGVYTEGITIEAKSMNSVILNFADPDTGYDNEICKNKEC